MPSLVVKKYLKHLHLNCHVLLGCGHPMTAVASVSFLILKGFLACLEIKTKERGSYLKYWLHQMSLFTELGLSAFILICLPFLGDASEAYLKHFSKELQDATQRFNMNVPLCTLGPAVIIFHETQHTDLLGVVDEQTLMTGLWN